MKTCARIRIFSSFSTNSVPTSRCKTSLRRLPSSLQSSSKLWKEISSAISSVVSVIVAVSVAETNQTDNTAERKTNIEGGRGGEGGRGIKEGKVTNKREKGVGVRVCVRACGSV